MDSVFGKLKEGLDEFTKEFSTIMNRTIDVVGVIEDSAKKISNIVVESETKASDIKNEIKEEKAKRFERSVSEDELIEKVIADKEAELRRLYKENLEKILREQLQREKEVNRLKEENVDEMEKIVNSEDYKKRRQVDLESDGKINALRKANEDIMSDIANLKNKELSQMEPNKILVKKPLNSINLIS